MNRRKFLKVTGVSGIGLQISKQLLGLERSNSLADEEIVYLTDLDRCLPVSGLSKSAKTGSWRMLDYETETLTGTMLVALEESNAPDLTYPLNRTGWYQIYLGIYRKPFESPKQVQLKLTSDPAYTDLEGKSGDTDHRENWIDDVYWKTEDLTKKNLCFRQIRVPRVKDGWIAYVKLVKLPEQQVRVLKKDRVQKETKRLFVHSDAHFSNPSGSVEEILKHIEPFRNSDVDRIYWEAGGGDRALYFSKIADDYGKALDEPNTFFPRTIDRQLAQTWKSYRQKGIDPLQVASEFTQGLGIEFHACYRTAGFVYPPPHDHIQGSFFENHPELVCVSKDGAPLPRISYAFPETRQYVISLFREMAEYPINGVCILYNRRPPLVAYETPLIEGFKSRYGFDPREMDDMDHRWLSYRCLFLTQFMRELRTELDRMAKEKRLKRLSISAVVFRQEENLLHGMDLSSWIEQGLVDTIIPYSSSVRLNSYEAAWENIEDVEYFASLVQGSNCRLALNLMPRNLTTKQYYSKARMLYQSGVKYLFFWDGINRTKKILRLGHRAERPTCLTDGSLKILSTKTRLKLLGGWNLNVETPG